MADPLDEHYRLLSEHDAIARFARAVRYLEESGCTYVVEGGWAVAAYGSPVPSVDLDVVYSLEDAQRLRDGLLEIAGIQYDTQGGTDLVGIDERYIDPPNALFGQPGLSYVPADILKDNVQRRPIAAVDGLEVPVPTADVLAFMKAKAFHDRRLQWEASRDPVVLASLELEDQAWVRTHPTAHWERKAGKDLFDLSFLLAHAADRARWPAFGSDRLAARLEAALQGIPLPLRRFANGMAERHGLDGLDVPPGSGSGSGSRSG